MERSYCSILCLSTTYSHIVALSTQTIWYPCGVKWCRGCARIWCGGGCSCGWRGCRCWSNYCHVCWWYPCGVKWCNYRLCVRIWYPWIRMTRFCFSVMDIITGILSVLGIVMDALFAVLRGLIPGLPNLVGFRIFPNLDPCPTCQDRFLFFHSRSLSLKLLLLNNRVSHSLAFPTWTSTSRSSIFPSGRRSTFTSSSSRHLFADSQATSGTRARRDSFPIRSLPSVRSRGST